MKALTLHEPWASLMCLPLKNVESRSWSTYYRGPLAIHAAAVYPQYARVIAVSNPIFVKALELIEDLRDPCGPTLGRILCIRHLTAVIPTSDSLRQILDKDELAFGNYTANRYAWFFNDTIKRFQPPIPAKGHQRLWNWEPK